MAHVCLIFFFKPPPPKKKNLPPAALVVEAAERRRILGRWLDWDYHDNLRLGGGEGGEGGVQGGGGGGPVLKFMAKPGVANER